MMDIFYKLIGKLAVPCSLEEWCKGFQNLPERQVGRDEIGGFLVSRVFLGLDHNFGDGDAILFETMIFADDDTGEGFAGYQVRYRTWDEAEKGHAAAVAYARARMAEIERGTIIPETAKPN